MKPPNRADAFHIARLTQDNQPEPLYADRMCTVPAPWYDDGLPVIELGPDDVYADLDGVGPEQAMIDFENRMIDYREGEL